jgi:hypothetical protein
VFLGEVKQTVNTPIVIDKLANIVNAHTPVQVRYFDQRDVFLNGDKIENMTIGTTVKYRFFLTVAD